MPALDDSIFSIDKLNLNNFSAQNSSDFQALLRALRNIKSSKNITFINLTNALLDDEQKLGVI